MTGTLRKMKSRFTGNTTIIRENESYKFKRPHIITNLLISLVGIHSGPKSEPWSRATVNICAKPLNDSLAASLVLFLGWLS
jgi:hypothetical protein